LGCAFEWTLRVWRCADARGDTLDEKKKRGDRITDRLSVLFFIASFICFREWCCSCFRRVRRLPCTCGANRRSDCVGLRPCEGLRTSSSFCVQIFPAPRYRPIQPELV